MHAFPPPLVDGWTLAKEFPDFPAADIPPIPPTWRDSCWHNNAAPSIEWNGRLWCWIDYADPALSEYPEARADGSHKRFTLCAMDNGEFVEERAPIAESDDWAAIMAAAFNELLPDVCQALETQGFELSDTGGNCQALRLECGAAEILATSADGVELPAADNWLLGAYDEDGRQLETWESAGGLSIDQALAAAIERARTADMEQAARRRGETV